MAPLDARAAALAAGAHSPLAMEKSSNLSNSWNERTTNADFSLLLPFFALRLYSIVVK
jgi:hypothetical protein